jgi:hypothetical protein
MICIHICYQPEYGIPLNPTHTRNPEDHYDHNYVCFLDAVYTVHKLSNQHLPIKNGPSSPSNDSQQSSSISQ